MRRFLARNALTCLVVVLALAAISCIPVTVRPQFDDQGKPIALPVTPIGSISPDGTLNPIYPVSNNSPTAFNWTAVATGASLVLNALLAAYGINLRGVAAKAKSALGIVCNLADANETAETDEQVKQNKSVAESLQIAAGVHALTQEVRGK